MSQDPGLQPQRTTLAWTRTGIGCAALTVLLARHVFLTEGPIAFIGAALAAAATVTIFVLGRRRRDQITNRLATGQNPALPSAMLSVAVLIGLIAMAVIATLLSG